MRKLFVLTLALAGALLLAAPAQAQHFRGNGGFNGRGFSNGFSNGYGFNGGYRYNFFPFAAQTYYYAPPMYVQPAYAVPAPVAPAYAAPAAPALAQAADPCAAAAGSYGVAPLDLAAGYSPFYGRLNVYGGAPLYFNGLGYHVYDVNTGRFVHVPSGLVTGAARVPGPGHEHFAAAGFRGPAPAAHAPGGRRR